ncbi:hypothetical protein EYF80_050025 [Liparis tanakae]|uniref:Uncharacterized protein n=1 Tax=Liparis tanakae TaxID=230148 RepID=A0A4Z2FFY8_9TELE|nr:hypothetical protein EYF80_050025 [Liparis tanakae]
MDNLRGGGVRNGPREEESAGRRPTRRRRSGGKEGIYRMLNFINCTAMLSQKPSMANLEAVPMTLLMTTMCPERLFFMSGITSLIMRTTPKKLVSNTLFISSMLMLSTGPSRPTPALLTGRKHTGGDIKRSSFK